MQECILKNRIAQFLRKEKEKCFFLNGQRQYTLISGDTTTGFYVRIFFRDGDGLFDSQSDKA